MEVTHRIQQLLTRYRKKTISSVELDELLVWIEGLTEEQYKQLAEANKELWEQAKAGNLDTTTHLVNWNNMLKNVLDAEKASPAEHKVRKIGWQRAVAAAAILLFITAGVFFLFNRKGDTPAIAGKQPQSQRLPASVLPNVNQTVLTLANGQQIVLDSASNGNLLVENGVQVVKLQTGEIAYNASGDHREPEYHTISVPRGGRPYQVLLADGSRIWLNAASSLRYPDFFTGDSRNVELTGEAYFEIAHDAAKPFRVTKGDMKVEVLGTHFNVMAYEDERSIQTTLLEGSVKVTAGNRSAMLVSGRQAQLTPDGNLEVVAANTDLAVAWVKGYFQFDKADVKTILRQVGRWYDLDVEYRGKVSEDLFSGKIERNLPLSGILKLIASENINIKVEGNKLIVL